MNRPRFVYKNAIYRFIGHQKTPKSQKFGGKPWRRQGKNAKNRPQKHENLWYLEFIGPIIYGGQLLEKNFTFYNSNGYSKKRGDFFKFLLGSVGTLEKHEKVTSGPPPNALCKPPYIWVEKDDVLYENIYRARAVPEIYAFWSMT